MQPRWHKFYLIGCGGVGSLLAPVLIKLMGAGKVVLVDGDKFEPKNLDRQLFDPRTIGHNKAAALGELYGVEAIDQWFVMGLLDLHDEDWLLVGADNHPARHAALGEADRSGCRVIIAANEVTSSEAYYYQPDWSRSGLDPRVYYPDIETDTGRDPAGCTGQAQERNRQLVTANFTAAALAGHLLTLWAIERFKLRTETSKSLPFHLRVNMTRMESRQVKDINQERTET